MLLRGVHFLATVSVILLSQVVSGKLNYITTKSGWMNDGDPYRKQLIELQNFGEGFALKRNHLLGGNRGKRDTGNTPVASTPFILRNDNHHYASVHYSGDESDVVFVLTYDIDNNHVTSSSLYRSTDYGKNFETETGKFPAWAKLYARYHVSQDKNTIVFADDNNRTIYVSKDEGKTYTHYSVEVNPKTLLFHPTMKDWILGYDESTHELKVSMNLGTEWTVISDNVRGPGDYSWGVPGIDWRVDAAKTSDLSRLYYNIYDSNHPNGVAVNSDVSLMITHYPFVESRRVFDNNLGLHDAFIIVDNYIFVQRTVNEENSEVELLVSYNRKPFSVAKIPYEDSHQDYYVGTYRSAQAFVVVRHTSGVDNLYFSDETGTYYSLSLDNIVLDVNSGLDLDLIDSMNGTFIANQYISGSRNIRTIITFDNGAEWHLLPAPEVTKNGDETDCEVPLCSLHLHMYSTDYNRLGIYSRSSAPGIIVALGKYGQHLADDGSVDLYVSRDGGLRWDQTLDGSWDVQIIDHGGLLVAAKDYHEEDETYIMYSCNEGRSWLQFNFTDTPTVIWGVVTEPGETTTKATLFGSENRTSFKSIEWAIISINFDGVFQRNCTKADYWDWAVSDGRIGEQSCLLGESRVLERRKTEICCRSGEKYERVVSAYPCECAREDFECDWGYRSDDYNGGTCVVDSSFSATNRKDKVCTSGYRKIAGDTCEGGITDDLLECTPSSASTTNSGNDSNDTTVLVILAILLAICFFLILLMGAAMVFMIRRFSTTRPHGHQLLPGNEPNENRFGPAEDDDVDLLRP